VCDVVAAVLKSGAMNTEFKANISALPNPIVPLSIVACVDTAKVDPLLKVFDLESATDLVTVAKISTVWLAKLAPKSSFSDLPVGEPCSVNIASPSWLLPVNESTSPTAPVPPLPVALIVTVKSFSAKPLNTSSVPAVIVSSPFDVNVFTKFLLTLKFVSDEPPLAVVFKVLIVSYGNLNNDIFFSGSCIFVLRLVTIVFVDTSEKYHHLL